MRQTYLTPEDSRTMASFRGQWRAAGWGVDGDCHTDVPYGEKSKFFAALFLPEDYKELLQIQHQNALTDFGRISPTPYETNYRAPAEPTMLDFETVFASPNFVYSATAKGVCLAAIRKASKLYPGQVPASLAQLADAAAAQFDYSTRNINTPIPEELFKNSWAE